MQAKGHLKANYSRGNLGGEESTDSRKVWGSSGRDGCGNDAKKGASIILRMQVCEPQVCFACVISRV